MTYRVGPGSDCDYPAAGRAAQVGGGGVRTLARFLFAALERMSRFAIARAKRVRDVQFSKGAINECHFIK